MQKEACRKCANSVVQSPTNCQHPGKLTVILVVLDIAAFYCRDDVFIEYRRLTNTVEDA